MAKKNEHNNIIRNAAKEILAPIGVFQKGRSRLWIDDNGWFLTIIEFQPSSWSKGAYLNISMHFLWGNIINNISFDYSFDINPRVHSHIEYTDNDSEFYNEMVKLSKIAAQEVKKYREFKDPRYAKRKLLRSFFIAENLWGQFNKAMLCFLCGDLSKGKKYMEVFSRVRHGSNEEINQFIKEQAGIYLTNAHSADILKKTVLHKIKEQREFYRSSELKDLQTHILYG